MSNAYTEPRDFSFRSEACTALYLDNNYVPVTSLEQERTRHHPSLQWHLPHLANAGRYSWLFSPCPPNWDTCLQTRRAFSVLFYLWKFFTPEPGLIRPVPLTHAFTDRAGLLRPSKHHLHRVPSASSFIRLQQRQLYLQLPSRAFSLQANTNCSSYF